MIPILRFYDVSRLEPNTECSLCGDLTVQVLEMGTNKAFAQTHLCQRHFAELVEDAVTNFVAYMRTVLD